MAQFPTQHFTPTSAEASAYAWDSLADSVIGHRGEPTSAKDLDEAFRHLSNDDAALLQKILYRVPKVKADPRLSRYEALKAEVHRLREEERASYEAAQAANEAAHAPFKAKAKALNEALMVGGNLVSAKSWGVPGLEDHRQYLSGRAFGHLSRLALEARLLKGEISQETYDEALAVLDDVYAPKEA